MPSYFQIEFVIQLIESEIIFEEFHSTIIGTYE